MSLSKIDVKALSTSWLYNRLKGYPHWLEVLIKQSEVKVEEDYKVYDFNGILGSVGGSLGLFIGFSFLDMMLHLMRKARKWGCCRGWWFCNKKKSKDSVPA